MNESIHRHDMSDALWTLIEPHIIGKKGTWGTTPETLECSSTPFSGY